MHLLKVLIGRSWLQRAPRALPEPPGPQEAQGLRVLQVPSELRDQLGLPETQDLLVLQEQLEPRVRPGRRVIRVSRV